MISFRMKNMYLLSPVTSLRLLMIYNDFLLVHVSLSIVVGVYDVRIQYFFTILNFFLLGTISNFVRFMISRFLFHMHY